MIFHALSTLKHTLKQATEKKNQLHHKEHHSESQGGGNTSYIAHLALLGRDDLGSTMILVQDTQQRAMGLGTYKFALTTFCAIFVWKIKKRESSAKLQWNNRTTTTAKSISVVQWGYLHNKFSTTLYACMYKHKYTTNITAFLKWCMCGCFSGSSICISGWITRLC